MRWLIEKLLDYVLNSPEYGFHEEISSDRPSEE